MADLSPTRSLAEDRSETGTWLCGAMKSPINTRKSRAKKQNGNASKIADVTRLTRESEKSQTPEMRRGMDRGSRLLALAVSTYQSHGLDEKTAPKISLDFNGRRIAVRLSHIS